MTSDKQIQANRINAQKGGVKTVEGKTISKLNPLKHGLLSREVLLKGESKQTYSELSQSLLESLQPISAIEEILADRIIANIWRLKRMLEVERTTMEWQKAHEIRSMHFDEKQDQIERNAIREMLINEDIEKLQKYETTIERSIYRALHELQRIQAARNGEKPPLPIALDVIIDQENEEKEG